MIMDESKALHLTITARRESLNIFAIIFFPIFPAPTKQRN